MANLTQLEGREREYARCVGECMSNAQIAKRLGVTENMACAIGSRVYARLGLNELSGNPRVRLALMVWEEANS